MNTEKLNCIMLIDDDEPTNFYNEIILKKSGYNGLVVIEQSCQAALDYLNGVEAGVNTKPQLIFLDINLPAMNGWEFLNEYRKIDECVRKGMVLVMLTTSFNPDDHSRAKSHEEVNEFLYKPLSKIMVSQLIDKYFGS